MPQTLIALGSVDTGLESNTVCSIAHREAVILPVNLSNCRVRRELVLPYLAGR